MRSQILDCPGGCGGSLIVPEATEDLLEAGRTTHPVFWCSKACRVTVGYAGRLQAEPRPGRRTPAPFGPATSAPVATATTSDTATQVRS